MSLEEAYEIAGGYKKVDEQTFLKALEIVKKDDPTFATALEEAHLLELKKQLDDAQKDSFIPTTNILESNTDYLESMLNNADINAQLLSDEEVKLALANTPIVETATDTPYELEGEERDKHIQMLVDNATLDVTCDLIEDHEFAQIKDPKAKKEVFFNELKGSFLGTLANLRLTSQLEHHIGAGAEAVKNNDNEFFDEQQKALANMAYQDNAIDFNQKAGISVDSIIAACNETEHKANRIIKKFNKVFEKINSSSKNIYQKAANLVHGVKTSFVAKAKELWGERYEFMNNLKDRAPKIITDVTATAALVGATAVGAPWLGTAAIAFGAYKAASSWMWPIVTKARKDARLEREKEAEQETDGAPKIGFWKRLKNASNSIFSNKEERSKYVKEAGWGSAAGLVGLGAAGAVLSGAVTIGTSAASAASGVVARSFQSLSSLAVHSVNSGINAVKTVKSKQTDGWTKAFVVGGAVLTSYLLYKCGSNTSNLTSADISSTPQNDLNDTNVQTELNSAPAPQETLPQDTTVLPQDTTVVQEASIKEEISSNTDALDNVVKNEIIVPTEYNESTMGITKEFWKRLQTYWDYSPEKYAEYYLKIDDSMLAEGGIFEGLTREQALFKYERLSTWNLLSQRETLAKLDAFFRDCDGSAELVFTEQDKNVLNDVMQDGSIRNVKGTLNIRVDARLGNDCGTESKLVVEKLSTTTMSTTTTTTVDITTQPAAEVAPVQFTQAEEVNINNEGTQLKASLYKSNNLYNGELVEDNIDAEKAVIEPVNKDIRIEDTELAGANTTDANSTTNNNTNPVEANIVFTHKEDVIINNTINDGTTSIENNVAFSSREDIIINSTVNTETTSIENSELFTSKEEVSLDNTGDTNTLDDSGNSSENVNNETSNTETTDFIATKSEIIEGVDNVEEGTPAAGNIEARGGYLNSGISEERYNKMVTFFKNAYGENAYEDFASRITEEMRAKGGIFEGLSVEQSMYSIQQMIAWSNDQTGAFANEITNMVDYLKDCNDVIVATDAQGIKAIIDSVNENGTIDGVTGDKPVLVRFFQANDCGEAGTYGLETGAEGVTNPGGDGFTRLFRRTWTEAPEPIFTQAEPINIYTPENEPLTATLNKGNGLVFGEEVKTVDASEAVIDAKNVRIRIETKDR